MYVQGVKMTELRPSEGRADKIGETVTVIGQGFTRVGELSCWFGDQHGTSTMPYRALGGYGRRVEALAGAPW